MRKGDEAKLKGVGQAWEAASMREEHQLYSEPRGSNGSRCGELGGRARAEEGPCSLG